MFYVYVAYIYILDTYRCNDNRRKNKDARRKTQEDFFRKIFTSHFIARVRVTLCLSCFPDVEVQSIGGFRGTLRTGVAFPNTSGL